MFFSFLFRVLDCHGVGVVFMNTRSILLCFHPKSSFVMHNGNVTLNLKFANLEVVYVLWLIFLLHFSFMLYSWNDLLHDVVVVCCVFLKCALVLFCNAMYESCILLPYFFTSPFQCVYF